MATGSVQNFLMWALNMRKDKQAQHFKITAQKISYYKN